MALHSTSDRYNYIYGNNVRKIDHSAVPKKEQTVVRPKKNQDKRKVTTGYAEQSNERNATKQARIRRNHEKVQDFDWRLTVVALGALFIISFCAVFYVQGVTHLNHMSTEISDLKTKKEKELSKQKALQTEIDKSINLDEIRSFAEGELHMIYPDTNHVIYFTDSADDYFRQYESVNASK